MDQTLCETFRQGNNWLIEKGGYVLVDFSEPLDDELQAVLVYTSDIERVMALAVEVGIYAAPALAALQAESEA